MALNLAAFERLQNQLEFTSNTYLLMADTAEYLKFFSETFPGQVLVKEIMELKVRIMVLHNSYGKLDFLVPEYQLKISRFYRHLRILKEVFKEVKRDLGENTHCREMFENRAVWADMALRKLWLQVQGLSPDCFELSNLESCWIE